MIHVCNQRYCSLNSLNKHQRDIFRSHYCTYKGQICFTPINILRRTYLITTTWEWSGLGTYTFPRATHHELEIEWIINTVLNQRDFDDMIFFWEGGGWTEASSGDQSMRWSIGSGRTKPELKGTRCVLVSKVDTQWFPTEPMSIWAPIHSIFFYHIALSIETHDLFIFSYFEI